MTKPKAAVIGVLLLAALTSSAAADGIAVRVGGDGWFIACDQRTPHPYDRGFWRGYADGYERGYRDGRSKRSTSKRWHRSARGWVRRPPHGWPRRPPHRRRPH